MDNIKHSTENRRNTLGDESNTSVSESFPDRSNNNISNNNNNMHSNLLVSVSDLEDEDDDMEEEQYLGNIQDSVVSQALLSSRSSSNTSGGNDHAATTTEPTDQTSSEAAVDQQESAPDEIPPEPSDNVSQSSGEYESEYEYEYEDEDECHISGFLCPDPHTTDMNDTAPAAARIPEDDTNNTASSSTTTSSSKNPTVSTTSSATVKTEKKKSTWKEPSRAAVDMSLRAEKESTGGRRRLACDLYKILKGDTEEQGFSIEPYDSDCMERWKIKLFKFDQDSYLHKDLMALGLDHVELEMKFPDQYPFKPPFLRIVQPRFKKQTGFVVNGAICSELLTEEGWSPINDIESVIVSIRSLLVVGNGRLEAAVGLSKRDEKSAEKKRNQDDEDNGGDERSNGKRKSSISQKSPQKKSATSSSSSKKPIPKNVGGYSSAEATAAHNHISDYHKKNGWNSWWARKG